MKGKGSKNNVANRGTGAAAKTYNGRVIKAGKLYDQKNKQYFVAALYADNGDLVKSPDGNYVKFNSVMSE